MRCTHVYDTELSEPIDVFSAWLDKCAEENEKSGAADAFERRISMPEPVRQIDDDEMEELMNQDLPGITTGKRVVLENDVDDDAEEDEEIQAPKRTTSKRSRVIDEDDDE